MKEELSGNGTANARPPNDIRQSNNQGFPTENLVKNICLVIQQIILNEFQNIEMTWAIKG